MKFADDDKVIACMRVAECLCPAKGSWVESCIQCGERIYVSPMTYKQASNHPGGAIHLVCLYCLEIDDNTEFVPPDNTTIQTITEHFD